MNLFKSNLTEEQDRLWKLVLETVERIQTEECGGRRGSRGVALLTSDGREVSTILDVELPDGTHKVFHVVAYNKSILGGGPKPQVAIDRWFHNAESYWERQLADRSNAVVIGGAHYRIGKGGGGGHGGRKFVIRFNDGREVTTNDLWCQGPIPPAFRDRLPDNATFVDTHGGAS